MNIDFDYLWLDNHKEKLTVLKEITQLKKFLLECCVIGITEYSPGWCMGYYDEETTIQDIKQVTKEIKQKILKYPTYNTYRKGA